jgi:beta-lactamase regulating signal transducer with metallopeptidase domain
MTTLAEHPALLALGWTLLHSLWQVAGLGLLAWVGLRLLRGRSPGARYGLACAALALMLALPVATWFLLLPALAEPVQELAGAAPKVTEAHGFEALRAALDPLLPWALALWGLGVAFMSLRLLGGWVWMQRLRRRWAEPAPAPWPERVRILAARLGVPGPVAILRSLAVDAPMVIGWIRPVILVPAAAFAGLAPAALEAVLAHELEHIRRHDYLVNLLQSVVEALLFYHPAAWWLSRQIRTEREHCCDDAAVALCGDPVLYARALASLEDLRAADLPNPTLALAANGGNLMNRIKRIILPKLPPSSAGRAGLLAVLAVSALGAATGMTLNQNPPPAPSAPPAAAVAPEAPKEPEVRVIKKRIQIGDLKTQAELEAKTKAFEAKAEAMAARHEAARKAGKVDADMAKLDQELAAMAKDIAGLARKLATREVREVHIPRIQVEGHQLHMPRIQIDGKDIELPEGSEAGIDQGDGRTIIIKKRVKGAEGQEVEVETGGPGERHIVIQKRIKGEDGKEHLQFETGGRGERHIVINRDLRTAASAEEIAALKAELAHLKARLDRLAPLAAPKPPAPPKPPAAPAPMPAAPKAKPAAPAPPAPGPKG